MSHALCNAIYILFHRVILAKIQGRVLVFSFSLSLEVLKIFTWDQWDPNQNPSFIFLLVTSLKKNKESYSCIIFYTTTLRPPPVIIPSSLFFVHWSSSSRAAKTNFLQEQHHHPLLVAVSDLLRLSLRAMLSSEPLVSTLSSGEGVVIHCVGEVYNKLNVSVLHLHSTMHPSRSWSMVSHLHQNQAMVLASCSYQSQFSFFVFCSFQFSKKEKKRAFQGTVGAPIFRNFPKFGQHSTMHLGILIYSRRHS